MNICLYLLMYGSDFHDELILFYYIVRPVKRDWAVLSKDTPLDISI